MAKVEGLWSRDFSAVCESWFNGLAAVHRQISVGNDWRIACRMLDKPDKICYYDHIHDIGKQIN